MMEQEEEEYVTIKIPVGKPYIIIVYESPNSAVCQIQKNGIIPAQVLGLAEYLRIECAAAFTEAIKHNQKIVIPGTQH